MDSMFVGLSACIWDCFLNSTILLCFLLVCIFFKFVFALVFLYLAVYIVDVYLFFSCMFLTSFCLVICLWVRISICLFVCLFVCLFACTYKIKSIDFFFFLNCLKQHQSHSLRSSWDALMENLLRTFFNQIFFVFIFISVEVKIL